MGTKIKIEEGNSMNKSSDFTWYELKTNLQKRSSHSSNNSEWLPIKLNSPRLGILFYIPGCFEIV
jgi:hypothetical protein